MALLALGINHKTASVQVREKVAFAPEQLSTAHQLVCALPAVKETVILSTCNRSEIYCAVNDESASADDVLSWLSQYHEIPLEELKGSAYEHLNLDAASHLAKVASGLDSLVLGEPQILGQLKSAYAVAQESSTVGNELNRLFQHSFSVAKQVRTQTAIGKNPVSVAYAAVSLSGHIFSELSKCTALLVGAGETIDLVARHLREKGVSNIIIANRTLARAQALAKEFNARAIMLGDIPDNLPQADIVITSTASQLPILGKGTVESAIKARKRAPIFMVDIAVPRDIEAEVADLSDVYLYTVDDLQEVIQENVRNREEAAVEAHEIVEANTRKFGEVLKARGAVDILKNFRTQVNDLKETELDKAMKRLANGEDAESVLRFFGNALANKFAHSPTVRLKQASIDGRDNEASAWLNELFGLDENS